MTTSRFGWAVAVPLLLLTASCAQRIDSAPTDDSGATPYPADALVLRIDHTGGFVPALVAATRLPGVSVYGDGRVLTQGPVPAVYPGPALPNIQVGTITADQVTDLVEQARAAGVGSGVDLGRPSITDVTTTRFTVHGPAGTQETAVYALGEATGPEAGLTPAQLSARARLRAFAQSLTDSSGTPTRPYQPTALVAVAQPWVAGQDGMRQAEVPWPGPALPGGSLGAGSELRCVTVTGASVRPVLDAATKANAATPWTHGGKRWTIGLRPLLPDETDCASLPVDR